MKYGKRFGIRADMAWAQMIHETGYGQYGGDVAPEQNNMVGIGATGGRRAGQLLRHGRIGRDRSLRAPGLVRLSRPSVRSLLRRVEQPADGPITTPETLGTSSRKAARPHKGNVRTVYDLSGKWAVGPDYGAAIQKKAAGISLSYGLW